MNISGTVEAALSTIRRSPCTKLHIVVALTPFVQFDFSTVADYQ